MRHILILTSWIAFNVTAQAQAPLAPPKARPTAVKAPQKEVEKPDTTYVRIDPSEIDCGLGWDQDLLMDGAVTVEGIDRPVIVKTHLTQFSCRYTKDPKEAEMNIDLVDGYVELGVFKTKEFGPVRVGVRNGPPGFTFQLQVQYLKAFRETLNKGK